MAQKEIYIVFGVSGSGKTTIGKMLADELHIPHYDADDFHPPSNLEKMRKGQPLNDEDRLPWLKALSGKILEWSGQNGAVLSCSALKERYRWILQSDLPIITWILLHGTRDLLAQRLNDRKGHFFDNKLLDSQLEALEVPDYGIKIDISNEPPEIIKKIINQLKA